MRRLLIAVAAAAVAALLVVLAGPPALRWWSVRRSADPEVAAVAQTCRTGRNWIVTRVEERPWGWFVRMEDWHVVYLGAEEFASYLHEGFEEPFAEARYADDLLRNRMLNELFHEAVPVILHEDDLNAMAFSIENRSPFLDRELFEHCYSIPTRHLVRDGRAKAVLRDAMRGLVPDAALDNRRKVGFNAPIHDLLGVDDPAVRARVLADGPLYEHVRRDRVAALLERPDLPNSESKLLFNLVNAQAFLEAA